MAYEFLTHFNAPVWHARPAGHSYIGIAIHHWDDPARRPTFDGTNNWLNRDGATASVHYVAEAGRVACHLDPNHRLAWHAGDGVHGAGNNRYIAIEVNPRWSDGDYQTVGELIRNLRAIFGDHLVLAPHNKFTSTSCPGRGDLARLDRIARAGAPAKTTKPKAPAAPKTANYEVVPGDTLSMIAYTFNTTVANVRKLNKMSGDKILAGQRLKVPAANTYKVRKGDTLSGIAAAKGKNWKTLADKNGLRPPYTIHPGQLLSLK